MSDEKPIAIQLADWTDWFCRNVKNPEDFRWLHMMDMATELRRLNAKNKKLLETLDRIEKWDEHSPELAADYGSVGVRDFYRGIARDAITKTGDAA